MIISIGCDHGGFLLKQSILEALQKKDIAIIDRGTNSQESVDYPLFAKDVCQDVQLGHADFGVLICTTGIGMSIVANKRKGIRAALVHCLDCSYLARQHNDSNVICLGAKYTSVEEGIAWVLAFIHTTFMGQRHARRIGQIEEDNKC